MSKNFVNFGQNFVTKNLLHFLIQPYQIFLCLNNIKSQSFQQHALIVCQKAASKKVQNEN